MKECRELFGKEEYRKAIDNLSTAFISIKNNPNLGYVDIIEPLKGMREAIQKIMIDKRTEFLHFLNETEKDLKQNRQYSEIQKKVRKQLGEFKKLGFSDLVDRINTLYKTALLNDRTIQTHEKLQEFK